MKRREMLKIMLGAGAMCVVPIKLTKASSVAKLKSGCPCGEAKRACSVSGVKGEVTVYHAGLPRDWMYADTWETTQCTMNLFFEKAVRRYQDADIVMLKLDDLVFARWTKLKDRQAAIKWKAKIGFEVKTPVWILEGWDTQSKQWAFVTCMGEPVLGPSADSFLNSPF